MWFTQDGALAHFGWMVREHLDNIFPRPWIGRVSEIAWPPRSLVSNPLDFSFWSQMKDFV